MKPALRSMGWRYVLVLVVLTVGAMVSIIVSDSYTAVACGVAVLIIAAVRRHRLKRPPEDETSGAPRQIRTAAPASGGQCSIP
jgi:hypothetical protein